MAITENLVSDFQKVQKTPESQRKEAMGSLCKDVLEGFNGKHFSVWKDLDFDKLASSCVSEDVRSGLMSGQDRLVESALDVMSSTQFPNLLGTAIKVGMWEYCAQSPMTIQNRVTQMTADCGQEVFWGYHPLGDIVDDDCLDEKEETPYKGICQPNKLTSPIRCKKKFAMGIAREMLCYDVNNQIQQLMRTGGDVIALHNGKLILRMLFGLHKEGANPWPYIQDDVPYDTYFKTAGSPWVNCLENNPLDGTYTPFEAIELHAEDLRDPWTGEPVDCQFRDVLVTSLDYKQKALRGLQPFSAEFDKTDANYGSNLKLTQERPATEFGNVFYDRYARDQLQDWYENVVGLNAADSKDAAGKTYLVGDIASAFSWVVEWPLETLERVGTDTREYWDQEIVYQIKYLWKAAPMVVNPRAVIRCVPTITGYTSYNGNGCTFTWQ